LNESKKKTIQSSRSLKEWSYVKDCSAVMMSAPGG